MPNYNNYSGGNNRGGYNNRSNGGGFNKFGGGKKPGNTVNKDFYNPYTFVSLSDKVYYLNEKEREELKVVHDVPLREGHSGKIVVDFESLSKLAVLGPGEKDRNNPDRMIKDSQNVDGRYFIPGSSIKGMLRNVFEIMTYSNIKNGMDNSRYSIRDLRNKDYELKDTTSKNPQKSGFLFKLNGKYYIQACDNVRYLYQDKKEEEADIKFLYPDIDIYRFMKAKTKEKYHMIGDPFMSDDEGDKAMWFFSGPMSNKKHEFLFYFPEFSETEMFEVQDKEWEDFLFIHEKENENDSWAYWKKNLSNFNSIEDVNTNVVQAFKGVKGVDIKVVPCFFRTKKTEDLRTVVKDLGFAFLYRQPYDKSMHEFLPAEYQKDGIDMSQAVFGYVNNEEALRGRVQVGNSFVDSKSNRAEMLNYVQGSPHATYYPFYLEQNNSPQKLDTYFSKGAVISGYKRYLRQSSVKPSVSITKDNSKVISSFYALPSGTKFSTTIYYHNLHDYELGALLSAITFFGSDASCCHSLGYAKALGYGKLKVAGCRLFDDSEKELFDFCMAFEKQMTDRLKISAVQFEDYLGQLISLASKDFESNEVRYPHSGMEKNAASKNNEFAAIKQQKLNMADFSPKK